MGKISILGLDIPRCFAVFATPAELSECPAMLDASKMASSVEGGTQPVDCPGPTELGESKLRHQPIFFLSRPSHDPQEYPCDPH